jgi:hypothetical protein
LCAEHRSFGWVAEGAEVTRRWRSPLRQLVRGSLQTEALALARRLRDFETMFKAAFYLIFVGPPEEWIERVRLAEEATTWPRDRVSGRALGMVLWAAGRLQLMQGNRALAEVLWKQLGDLAEGTNVATLLGKQQAAATLMRGLSCVANLAGCETFYTCVGRHLGDAAVLCGDPQAARNYYDQALESAAKIRFRPELALTHLRLAELAHEHELSVALTHLDTAIPELRAMNMQPALERALLVSERVASAPVREPQPGSTDDGLTAREREVARLLMV